MKTFDNEWILDAFAGRASFFTKRMFGGLAAYLHERQMLVLVEPTKTGRWKWHGVLVCTDHEHHVSIRADFPALMPHRVLRKWLYIDSSHDDFESTMESVAKRIVRNDPRFGVVPRSTRRKRSLTVVALVVAALLAVAHLAAQRDTPASALQFEVASVKPVAFPENVVSQLLKAGGTCALPTVERSGNRVRVPFGQLCGLIRLAYDVAQYQVVGIANREASNFVEIEARAKSETTPTIDDTRLMLRALLADRFRLKVHREARDAPVYVLTPVNGGPKLTACSNPESPSVYAPGRLLSCKSPMPLTRVAQFLSRETDRPVFVGTGLMDAYSFELHWLPEGAETQPDSPPSLFTAIQEQLGLKLESRRGTVDTIVVDEAQAPSPN